MNLFTDANIIYEAGTKAMSGSKWKYETQLFEMNHLLETAKIQQTLINGTYTPGLNSVKFSINERGKTRYITSNSITDKTVYHILSDEVLKPVLDPYVIYENTASQKNKGVGLFRKQLENGLHEYYRKYRSNDGYILLADFSGYYPNLLHDKIKEILYNFLDRSYMDFETIDVSKDLINKVLKTFELDVSRFTDEEIKKLYNTKIDPMMNTNVPKHLITGSKFLKKGVDIGAQPSQDIGVIYPYMIDNYAKIVCGLTYGRYTDDIYMPFLIAKKNLLIFLTIFVLFLLLLV